MNVFVLGQWLVFVFVVLCLVKPLGAYLERIFERQATPLDPILSPVERTIFWLLRVRLAREVDWKQYALASVLFGIVNMVVLSALLRWQAVLPWFFPGLLTTPMTPNLAVNTAVSFVTTTTWQA